MRRPFVERRFDYFYKPFELAVVSKPPLSFRTILWLSKHESIVETLRSGETDEHMIERLPEFQKTNAGLFLGLDLGKKQSQLAVLTAAGEELANFAFPSSRENFGLLAGHLRGNDKIAVEVSTSANGVMSVFAARSECEAVLSNPLFSRAISKARVKSDREDRAILDFGFRISDTA